MALCYRQEEAGQGYYTMVVDAVITPASGRVATPGVFFTLLPTSW